VFRHGLLSWRGLLQWPPALVPSLDRSLPRSFPDVPTGHLAAAITPGDLTVQKPRAHERTRGHVETRVAVRELFILSPRSPDPHCSSLSLAMILLRRCANLARRDPAWIPRTASSPGSFESLGLVRHGSGSGPCGVSTLGFLVGLFAGVLCWFVVFLSGVWWMEIGVGGCVVRCVGSRVLCGV
jgi:hypothetical protein